MNHAIEEETLEHGPRRYAHGRAAGFLSAVADRFGLWGPIGTPGVSWGGFAKFLDYTATILPYLSTTLVAVAGWAATVAEIVLGVALLAGVRVRLATLASGVLLLTFAIAMTTARPRGAAVVLSLDGGGRSLLVGPGPAGRVPEAADCSVNQTTQPGQRLGHDSSTNNLIRRYRMLKTISR